MRMELYISGVFVTPDSQLTSAINQKDLTMRLGEQWECDWSLIIAR